MRYIVNKKGAVHSVPYNFVYREGMREATEQEVCSYLNQQGLSCPCDACTEALAAAGEDTDECTSVELGSSTENQETKNSKPKRQIRKPKTVKAVTEPTGE